MEKARGALWSVGNVLGGGYTGEHMLKTYYTGKNALSLDAQSVHLIT